MYYTCIALNISLLAIQAEIIFSNSRNIKQYSSPSLKAHSPQNTPLERTQIVMLTLTKGLNLAGNSLIGIELYHVYGTSGVLVKGALWTIE